MQKRTKMMLAASGTGLALLIGGVGVANADSNSPGTSKSLGASRIGGDAHSPFSHVLSVLVAKGTITQAQADAIVKEASNERATQDASHAASETAHETLIATTIGSDWPTILKRLQAGDSLATIAGAKTAALISALVNEAGAQIDAGVNAGRITSTQATTIKANLQEHITAAVNGTGHPDGMFGGPAGFRGRMGNPDGLRHQGGPLGFMGHGAARVPNAPSVPSA
ncbi:MAG TPA: hypothetical protein VMV52_06485 [Candidatus Nanopelagicaceae bacterium]|nr:hypothetical protein [Candidatus Nanopelagicaceae bacterium]